MSANVLHCIPELVITFASNMQFVVHGFQRNTKHCTMVPLFTHAPVTLLCVLNVTSLCSCNRRGGRTINTSSAEFDISLNYNLSCVF